MIVWKKSFTVLFLLLFFVMGNDVTVKAKTQQGTSEQPLINVQTRYTNTSSITVVLSFNNGKGTLSGSVYGKPGASSITGYAVLERLNSDGTYTEVASWTGLSATGNTLLFSKTYYVSRWYTYRLTLTATVYKDGVGETVSNAKSAYAS